MVICLGITTKKIDFVRNGCYIRILIIPLIFDFDLLKKILGIFKFYVMIVSIRSTFLLDFTLNFLFN